MFDVIVGGGGPAGLLLASELAPSCNVALFERGRFGDTNKFWISTRDRLKEHGLENCIVFETDRGVVKTFLGDPSFATGNHAVVDESTLLLTLKEKAISCGATLYEFHELVALSWSEHSISAEFSSGQALNGRYFIDATGGQSPVIASLGFSRTDGFYSIYGSHLRNIQLETADVIGADVRLLGSPVPIFELVPTGNDSAHCVVFVAGKRTLELEKMRSLFEWHCSNNPYFTISDDTIFEERMGVIPIGRILPRSNRIPRLSFFGESGFIQPPLLGTAFNEILLNVNDFATSLLATLESRGKYIKTPGPTWHKRFNNRLQLALARRILDGSAVGIEEVSCLLRKLGPETSYRLFLNDLSWFEMAQVVKFALIQDAATGQGSRNMS